MPALIICSINSNLLNQQGWRRPGETGIFWTKQTLHLRHQDLSAVRSFHGQRPLTPKDIQWRLTPPLRCLDTRGPASPSWGAAKDAKQPGLQGALRLGPLRAAKVFSYIFVPPRSDGEQRS